MTALTIIGTVAGLLVLVLATLAPALVALNDRFPVKPEPTAHPAPKPAWGPRVAPTH